MDDLTNLSRVELEELARGLRRNIVALKLQARRDLMEIEDLQGDNRSLRRAVHRLRRQLDAAEQSPQEDP